MGSTQYSDDDIETVASVVEVNVCKRVREENRRLLDENKRLRSLVLDYKKLGETTSHVDALMLSCSIRQQLRELGLSDEVR